MNEQSVTAVFQEGVLKPLQPIDLVENEQVELHIVRSRPEEKVTL